MAPSNFAREPRESLLVWQWRTYERNHRNRTNLILHLITVPLFRAAVISGFVLPIWAPWWVCLVCLGFAAICVAVQSIGHKKEEHPPIPFKGPVDALLRILSENFLTFGRYVRSPAFLLWIRKG